MPVKFTVSQINDIIRLRTVERWGIKRIGKEFGVGDKPIARILRENGIYSNPVHIVELTNAEKSDILNAYDSGIGAAGIHKRLGLKCSSTPVIRFLREKRGELRNKSQQQSARMRRSTPEEIAHLTKRAHESARGRKATDEERHRQAKAFEGRISTRSKYEPVVWDILKQNFSDVLPGKAVHRYNIDFAVNGSVAVEVFGGGWSISDRKRIDRYIRRTKQLAERGFHTVFIVLLKDDVHGLDWDQFVRTIDFASRHPSSERKYWVVWGDFQGASGPCSDIDHSAFVSPFINVRDSATGRYQRVAR